MANGEILKKSDLEPQWEAAVKPLLDSYLCAVGILSGNVRSRWVEYVLQGLRLGIGSIAAHDIPEEAIERLRDALDVRLATTAELDPIRERREIAATLVVLQDQKHADLLNTVFAAPDLETTPEVRERLRVTFAAERPIPLPADAPMDMPVQAIALRSLNPMRPYLRRLR